MHLRAAALLLCLAALLPLRAQHPELQYRDHTYSPDIKTVRLHVAGFPSSYPIINLGGGARLRLSFDDLSDEVGRYAYRFIHCNQDWTPSSLGPMEYNSGFESDYLEEFDFSLRTLMPYTHYDLIFPNRNMQLNKSGNYLLVVYDNQDGDRPILTRRFLVSENTAGISGQVNRPSVVDKLHTHQEIQLRASTKQLGTRAPLRELTAAVLQNGRWDNAVTGVKPNLLGREEVTFNYQDKIVFRGGNEFRNLDIRSVQAPRSPVSSISNELDRYAMVLAPEETRGHTVYVQYFDLNGDFLNFRDDRPVVNLADEELQQTVQRFGLDFTGDYIETTFILRTPTGLPLDDDIYIFGALTNWQLQYDYRMVWNPNIGAYVGRVLLKQGFYNYYYVTDRGGGQIGLAETESSYEEAENDYIALLYHRPLGGRYDRLVGTSILTSGR